MVVSWSWLWKRRSCVCVYLCRSVCMLELGRVGSDWRLATIGTRQSMSVWE